MFRAVFKTFREVWAEDTGRGLILGALAILATGTGFFWIVERWSFIDALYFTVITLTTVGYGDLHPTNDLSKIFAVVFVITGVGFILAFLNYIVTRTIKDRVQGKKNEDE